MRTEYCSENTALTSIRWLHCRGGKWQWGILWNRGGVRGRHGLQLGPNSSGGAGRAVGRGRRMEMGNRTHSTQSMRAPPAPVSATHLPSDTCICYRAHRVGRAVTTQIPTAHHRLGCLPCRRKLSPHMKGGPGALPTTSRESRGHPVALITFRSFL